MNSRRAPTQRLHCEWLEPWQTEAGGVRTVALQECLRETGGLQALGMRQLMPPCASEFHHTAPVPGQQSGWSLDVAGHARQCQAPLAAVKRIPKPRFHCASWRMLPGEWNLRAVLVLPRGATLAHRHPRLGAHGRCDKGTSS